MTSVTGLLQRSSPCSLQLAPLASGPRQGISSQGHALATAGLEQLKKTAGKFLHAVLDHSRGDVHLIHLLKQL